MHTFHEHIVPLSEVRKERRKAGGRRKRVLARTDRRTQDSTGKWKIKCERRVRQPDVLLLWHLTSRDELKRRSDCEGCRIADRKPVVMSWVSALYQGHLSVAEKDSDGTAQDCGVVAPCRHWRGGCPIVDGVLIGLGTEVVCEL